MIALPDSFHLRLRELDRARRSEDEVLKKINKFHLKLVEVATEKAEKYPEKLWEKLRTFYTDAKQLAESEESAFQHCIKEVEALNLPNYQSAQRRKSGKANSHDTPFTLTYLVDAHAYLTHGPFLDGIGPSPWPAGTEVELNDHKRKKVRTESLGVSNRAGTFLSSSHPPASLDHSISIGDQVAARRSPDDAEKDDWIVVKVTRFDRENNRYEVIDEEPGDDEESSQRKYRLPASCIIPLPKRPELISISMFPPGSQVLAVYPGTTALYRARVAGPPRKRKSDDYLLEFDDDEEEGLDGIPCMPQRQVPYNHVVQLPDGHRQ
eukprot:SM000034S12701  [mRNA]  locus=s34:314032:316654:+ [translate_table: standard]